MRTSTHGQQPLVTQPNRNRISARDQHPEHPLLRLQRLVGNQAVLGLVRRATASSEDGAIGLEGGPVGDALAHRIEQARSSGELLDRSLQTQMEAGFGADLSDVRVHTGAESEHLNRQLTARAFTVGSDIFLGLGTDLNDRRTLAHELTHVVQQRSIEEGGPLTVGAADDAYEREAEAVALEVESQPAKTSAAPLGSAGFERAQQSVGQQALSRMLSPAIQRDVGSDDYNAGYMDGRTGSDPHAVPRDGDALTDYNEGYARGQYEYSQGKVPYTPGPSPEPNQSSAPAPIGPPEQLYTPAPPPEPNQSSATTPAPQPYQGPSIGPDPGTGTPVPECSPIEEFLDLCHEKPYNPRLDDKNNPHIEPPEMPEIVD